MRTVKMLRAVTLFYVECKATGIVFRSRRDVFKVMCAAAHTSSTNKTQIKTVLMSPRGAGSSVACNESVASASEPAPQDSRVAPPPVSRFTSAWTLAAAFAITASLGGVYFYKKLDQLKDEDIVEAPPPSPKPHEPPLLPASATELPAKVDFLLVGGGTASFAAFRALRAARPTATILLTGEERAPPYMRPPLSKEVWREASLPVAEASTLSFRQWSGRRRWLTYEPRAFYQPPAAAALGWTLTNIDVDKREATLQAAGQTHTVQYDQCLLAPGSRARALRALAGLAAAGRARVLRAAGDAAELAAELDRRAAPRLLVVGGGLLGSEISASISAAQRAQVTLAIRSKAPLSSRLPGYLATDVAATLTQLGVELITEAEVVDGKINEDGSVTVFFADGRSAAADVVLQCVGAEPRTELAEKAGLEIDAVNGGVVVDAELRARSGVFCAGDAASFYSRAAGRRRAQHHDHAVRSGRRAAANMAAAAAAPPPPPHIPQQAAEYDYKPMFWSDLGPELGYEAVGVIDSRLKTVGIFSEEFVNETTQRALTAGGDAEETPAKRSARKYERGVVFYLQGKRVVGVLLWNLFNKVTLATQVLAKGEFEDLMEVAKLFNPHEEQ